MRGHMTGLNVRTPISARRLVGGIRGRFYTVELRALSFVKEAVRKEIRVSLLMEFLSVGFILLVIELTYVKIFTIVAVAFVSLPTP